MYKKLFIILFLLTTGSIYSANPAAGIQALQAALQAHNVPGAIIGVIGNLVRDAHRPEPIKRIKRPAKKIKHLTNRKTSKVK